MYAHGIDHNVMPTPTLNSGPIDRFPAFNADAMMQRTPSGQYFPEFASTDSFGNGYQLNYPMNIEPLYVNGPQSFGTGNQNNPSPVLYQNYTAMQSSAASQYREFCHSPHDQRR
jgi:hypothetical protein